MAKNGTWLRSIEKIQLEIRNRQVGIVGLSSPTYNECVSKLAIQLANSFLYSGFRTLFVDFSLPVEEVNTGQCWFPGDEEVPPPISISSSGLEIFSVRPLMKHRHRFNNVNMLRDEFSHYFSHYEVIIIELPAMLQSTDQYLNPLNLASICDGVFLVCEFESELRHNLHETGLNLENANINALGVVMSNQ